MSGKRSRGAFEADVATQQSPFVLFGTPLPPIDPDVRDDGSYVPLWKQEVRDERGRKRLHGAFTGGWSAGYFNTVGSKEGWTPSTFVSSRANRRKDDPKAGQQRPEDFMDAEDLADAEESRQIQTQEAFSGIRSADDANRSSALSGLFRPDGATMGTKLLEKMGWRQGQGVGPKVRRTARLEMSDCVRGNGQTHLFAPENVAMISFVRKADRKGLGYQEEVHLSTPDLVENGSGDDDEKTGRRIAPAFTLGAASKSKTSTNRGGIGLGVLNDTGSDDEDPFELGPKISYNRVMGGAKKKKKKKKKKISATASSVSKDNSSLVSTKSRIGGIGGLRKCHDGRLPLDGFVLGKAADSLTTDITSRGKYPPPLIPPDWKSSKVPGRETTPKNFVSTADAAKTSTLDPKVRAAMLGEQQLPGKSVFDFLTPAARERLAAATGRTDLPPARGEQLPASSSMTEEQRVQQIVEQIPKLDKDTATAALSRSASGGAPYADDDDKRSRYRAYLEHQAGFVKALPPRPPGRSHGDWINEFHEFYNCARIFRPMSGLMASRFTTSSTSAQPTSASGGDMNEQDLVTRLPPKPQDPAEEAAKLGMFGHMTRSVSDFYPARLLCKRFNVKPPAHVQSAAGADSVGDKQDASHHTGRPGDMASEMQQPAPVPLPALTQAAESPNPAVVVDSTTNQALEGNRAGEEVFRAIFGDSDEE